jgi:hypothetical protein
MIRDDQELQTTQERIANFLRLLAQLRVKATPGEFSLVVGGYRAQVERMHREVLDYLTPPPWQPPRARLTTAEGPQG